MNWFVAKIVFQVECADRLPQYDEQIRIFQSDNALEALEKAMLTGLEEEISFSNQQDEPVKWSFVDVAEVYPLDSLKDGALVYSQTCESDSHPHYKEAVEEKGDRIRNFLMMKNLHWIH